MSLQKKRLLKQDQKQESSTAKKTCTSLPSDCLRKAPIVLLYDLKSELGHQNKEQNKKQRDHGRQSSQEHPPDDGSVHSKSSLPLHSKLLVSNIDFTYHQQQDTTEDRGRTSLPIESLKIPVAPPFLSNVRPETQGKESANEYDRAQHQSQKEQRTDQQESPSVNTSYTSLEEVYKLKKPIIQVHRLETQLDQKIKRSSTLQSEQFFNQCTDFTRKHDRQKRGLETVCLKQPVLQLTRLNIETKSQIERHTTKEGVSAHHQDHVHPSDSTPINVQPENWEEQVEDDSDSYQSDEQCREITRKHDQQKCGLQTVCLKQPVVQLTRLNIEAKSQVERQTTKEVISAHHQDYVPDNTPLNVQLENREVQMEDDSDSDQSDEQCTDFARNHDRQKCGLETASLMQPVVQLTRLNIKNHVERQPENREEQVEDDSDIDQYDEQISAYERERLRNIKVNAKFLKSLKLLENASTLWLRQKKKRVIREKPPCDMANRESRRLRECRREKPPCDMATRESRRLRGCSPLEKTTQMVPVTDKDAWISFQDTWKSVRANKFEKPTSFKCRDLTSYADSLSKLRQDKTTGMCTVPGAVSAIAVHPSNTHSLVAARDLYGSVVLWNRNLQTPGKYTFPLHTGQFGVVKFSPSDSQHLLSLGQEGTVYCADLDHSTFTQIYQDEERLTCFDFLSDSGSVLLVGHLNSRLSVVDCRTNTHDEICSRPSLSFLYSISVHPLQKHLFVAGGCRNVLLYDTRMLRIDKRWRAEPLMGFLDDSDSIPVSATFSPDTGKYILTTFRDRCIRVFTVEDFTQNTYPLNFEENIHPFNSLYGYPKKSCKGYVPVAWDPKQENCFAEGLMNNGQINVFNVKGQTNPTTSPESSTGKKERTRSHSSSSHNSDIKLEDKVRALQEQVTELKPKSPYVLWRPVTSEAKSFSKISSPKHAQTSRAR